MDKTIIYRGTVTIDRLKELAAQHLQPAEPTATVTVKKPVGGPTQVVADGMFIIVKDPDGNYSGLTKKFGRVVSVRDIGPEIVLLKLLTHDGTV